MEILLLLVSPRHVPYKPKMEARLCSERRTHPPSPLSLLLLSLTPVKQKHPLPLLSLTPVKQKHPLPVKSVSSPPSNYFAWPFLLSLLNLSSIFSCEYEKRRLFSKKSKIVCRYILKRKSRCCITTCLCSLFEKNVFFLEKATNAARGTRSSWFSPIFIR